MRVFVTAGNRTRFTVVHSWSDFLSQESRVFHVGVGNGTVARVRVVWPDGTERSFTDVLDGRFLTDTPGGIEHRGNESA